VAKKKMRRRRKRKKNDDDNEGASDNTSAQKGSERSAGVASGDAAPIFTAIFPQLVIACYGRDL
jgi:hypothetical protein